MEHCREMTVKEIEKIYFEDLAFVSEYHGFMSKPELNAWYEHINQTWMLIDNTGT